MSDQAILLRFQTDYDEGYAQGVKICANATPDQIAEYRSNLKSWGLGPNTERGAFIAGWLKAADEREAQ